MRASQASGEELLTNSSCFLSFHCSLLSGILGTVAHVGGINHHEPYFLIILLYSLLPIVQHELDMSEKTLFVVLLASANAAREMQLHKDA